MREKIALTGAFSYTGRYITKLLIEKIGANNLQIINFTNRKEQCNLSNDPVKITTYPYDFDRPDSIIKALEGCSLFICTYWVRFDNFRISRQQVIDNAKLLIDCAKQANVKRCVYTSHTQSDVNSHIPYISGKAQVENHVKEQFEGCYGIIKPCTIFGDTPQESIVINNLAYLIRTFPMMAIVGNGKYPLHPVHVRDLARLCIEAGFDDHGQKEYDWDAVNPEKSSFIDLLKVTKDIIGAKCWLQTNVPEELAFLCTKPLNWMHNDILIDRTDIDLLTHGITCSHKEPLGKICYSDWVHENKNELGNTYINTIQRYYN